MKFRVKALVKFIDGNLAHLTPMPWEAGEVRDLSEEAWKKCLASGRPETFELVSKVVPESTVKKASDAKQKTDQSD